MKAQALTQTNDSRTLNTTALLMLVLVALAMPDMAWAGTGSNPIENGINSAISFINSAVIRGLG
ncbi:hypothetical protein ABTQ03_19545, partial [Acinetobacter baumannii]